eukprot:NODE_2609_length_1078_cov_13.014577_g2172_i0.p9 GENE.NODE_2609_length_1078_cov_13.014577_g2172_i0~~NODE_2609_length_1078_cov_13.014577_g2172_i0.p9  ORF type:complete len:59 (-),score=1.12 NODE_2609_length_1078_cov_13.014577_g2172_i0:153-329(-)
MPLAEASPQILQVGTKSGTHPVALERVQTLGASSGEGEARGNGKRPTKQKRQGTQQNE